MKKNAGKGYVIKLVFGCLIASVILASCGNDTAVSSEESSVSASSEENTIDENTDVFSDESSDSEEESVSNDWNDNVVSQYKNLEYTIIEDLGDGFTLSYAPDEYVFLISGKGIMPEKELNFKETAGEGQAFILVIDDKVTELNIASYNYGFPDKVIIGKGLKSEKSLSWLANESYTVDRENKTFYVYNDALYTEEYRKLVAYPSAKTELNLHPDVTEIGDYALARTSISGTLIIPWGVEILGEEFAFGIKDCNIILPDTIRVVNNSFYMDKDYSAEYIFSKKSFGEDAIFRDGRKNGYHRILEASEVDSVAKYYDIEANSFKTFGSRIYYFDENGKMARTVKTIDGKKYYFGGDGVLKE